MPEIHAARLARAQEKLAEWGVDGALITSLVNVRYLTGLASSNAALLLPARGPGVLATAFRYAESAARDCGDLELVVERFIGLALASVAVARGMSLLGFEGHVMTVAQHEVVTALDGARPLWACGSGGEERGTRDGQGREGAGPAVPGLRDHRRGVLRRPVTSRAGPDRARARGSAGTGDGRPRRRRARV